MFVETSSTACERPARMIGRNPRQFTVSMYKSTHWLMVHEVTLYLLEPCPLGLSRLSALRRLPPHLYPTHPRPRFMISCGFPVSDPPISCISLQFETHPSDTASFGTSLAVQRVCHTFHSIATHLVVCLAGLCEPVSQCLHLGLGDPTAILHLHQRRPRLGMRHRLVCSSRGEHGSSPRLLKGHQHSLRPVLFIHFTKVPRKSIRTCKGRS